MEQVVDGQRYVASTKRSADFLRLAARFFEVSEQVAAEPSMRRPKLS